MFVYEFSLYRQNDTVNQELMNNSTSTKKEKTGQLHYLI